MFYKQLNVLPLFKERRAAVLAYSQSFPVHGFMTRSRCGNKSVSTLIRLAPRVFPSIRRTGAPFVSPVARASPQEPARQPGSGH